MEQEMFRSSSCSKREMFHGNRKVLIFLLMEWWHSALHRCCQIVTKQRCGSCGKKDLQANYQLLALRACDSFRIQISTETGAAQIVAMWIYYPHPCKVKSDLRRNAEQAQLFLRRTRLHLFSILFLLPPKMAAPDINTLKRSSDADGPSVRKVRKGTQSCWECKRRKVRCTFARPENSICELCMQRGTLCVSQELPDPGRTSQIDDRIGRVETVLEDVLRRLPAQDANQQASQQQREQTEHGINETPQTFQAIPQNAIHVTQRPNSRQGDQAPEPNPGPSNENDELTHKLMTAMGALPSQHEIDLISREPFEVPSCLHGLPCVQPLDDGKVPFSLQELTRLPPVGSRPILLARKHLILASYMQTLSQDAVERLRLLGIDHQVIASNAVQTARRMVLSNQELIRSIDGVECLVIESMYYNNAGQLRDAWLILRSAIAIAQLLGVDRRAFPLSSQARHIRQESQEESVWVQMLASDRYLSLMLGLPQGAPSSNYFAVPEALAPHPPEERLRRTHCLAGGIMLRHTDHREDAAYIEEVDVLLREAAAGLSPQWWLIPESLNRGQPVTTQDTLRVMTQFTHYHMIARLHLPYLLRSPADGTFDPHKLTTINASREILARYLALRGSRATNNYCRGVNFLMFIASTTLCITHINASHWRRLNEQGPQFDFLAHQRPGDRGLMERALETLRHPIRSHSDEIDSKIASGLGHLLDVEAESVAGSTFTISTFVSDNVQGCTQARNEDGQTLEISIPYVGNIKISRDGTSASRSSTSSRDGNNATTGPSSSARADNGREHVANPVRSISTNSLVGHRTRSQDTLDLALNAQDWSLQGVDIALFNDLIQDWNVDALEI